MNQNHHLRILSPCHRDRDSLEGSGAELWCPECSKTVYDFARMKRAEIEAVCTSGDACGIASYQYDGSLRTADPVAMPALLRRRFLEWSAAAAMSARLVFAQKLNLPPLPEGKGGIHGVVMDATGSPIVTAHALTGALTARTSEGGRFVLAPVVPGEVDVRIECAGFIAVKRPVVVRQGEYLGLGTVILQVGSVGGGIEITSPRDETSPKGAVKGKLISDGAPVVGLWISLVRIGPNNLDQRTRSDEKGRFHLKRVARGDYELIVDGLGWKAHRALITAGPGTLDLGRIVMRHE